MLSSSQVVGKDAGLCLLLGFSIRDQPGIVARVSSWVAALGQDFRDAQVHVDADSGLFFSCLVHISLVGRDEVALHWAPSRGRSVRAPCVVQWTAEQRAFLDGNRTVVLV